MALICSKRRSLRRLNFRNLVDDVSGRGRRQRRRIVLLRREQRVHEIRSIAHAGELIGLRDQVRRSDTQISLSGSFIQPVGARQGLDGTGNALRLSRGLLLLEEWLDFYFHFLEGLQPRLLLGFDMNDVEAVAGADDIRSFVRVAC